MIDLQDMRKKGYIIKLQGREYTTHAGLLATAHENGLKEVTIEMVSWDPQARAAVMMATAKGTRGSYTDFGDASPSNVGKMIANACIRMAATRASSRALRLYLGVGMTCFEELPGKDPEPHKEEAPPVPQKEVAPRMKKVKEQGRIAFFYDRCVEMNIEPELAAFMVQKNSGKSPEELAPERIDKALSWLNTLDDETLGKWHADFLDLAGKEVN